MLKYVVNEQSQLPGLTVSGLQQEATERGGQQLKAATNFKPVLCVF